MVIAHGILDDVKLALPETAIYYGGKKVSKPEQYKLFEQNNIPVAPWLTNPESWEEVFDKLGNPYGDDNFINSLKNM